MQSDQTPGTRVHIFRKELGKNQRDFSALIGFSHTMLGAIEKGKKPPSRRFLEALADRFDVSPTWILYGEGPMRRNASLTVEQVTALREANHQKLADILALIHGDEFEPVDNWDAIQAHQHGTLTSDTAPVQRLAFLPEWLRQMGVDLNKGGLMTVPDDSMLPTLQAGDLVLADRGRTEIINNHVYAFRDIDGTQLVRRLELIPDKQILIRSDNPAFDTEIRPAKFSPEYGIIGEVVWFARTL